LALELHPAWSGTLVVGPRCDLDRELGYDSLARAELLLRLNRAFGIALPDQLIVEAATAGDVAEAVAAAAPRAAGALPQTAVRTATLPEAAAPEDATTLVEMLVAHVRAHPDRTHVHLWQGEQVEEALSYGALDRAARTLAQRLVDAGIERGDRVAIMLPTSLGFFQAFFGAILAGAVPVPIYPPLRRAQIEDHLRRQAGILRLAAGAAAGRLAQGVRTAGDFACAAWWWTALVLVAAVVWPLVVILPRRRWRHAVLRRGARALFALTGIRFTTDSDSPVPDRDVVIVVNHTSYLDGAAVSAAIPGPLAFVVTVRFARQFFAGTLLRRLGTVFVGEAGSGLHGSEDAVLRAVRAGERLVVFPEGRLRRMPGLLSFYPGPFLVAAEASMPVVPVNFSGTRSVLRHSGQWFPRRAPIHVHVGRPIHARGTDFDAALALGQAARDAILAAGREPDLGREEIEFGILRDG
jgi:1-acyl-sn-glycerol-3-phosphate acyltransferase